MRRSGRGGGPGTRVLTFASSSVRVSSRAVFTIQAKRSPRIRMRGPVMLTTEGRSASGEVSLMTAPSALAASSFCSGLPVRTPSLSTGRMQVTPCGGRRRKTLLVPVRRLNQRVPTPAEEPHLLGQTETRQVLTLDLCGCGSDVPVKVVDQSQLAAGIQFLAHRTDTD